MSVSCEHCGEGHAAAHMFCPVTGKLIPSRLLPPGELLEGKYRIGPSIGVGGMGAVFEARHVMLDKRVAVKVMLPGPSADDVMQLSARMIREARVASATGHRNIALVTDMGWVREGLPFFVMEFLEGQTLKMVLAEEPVLPVPRAAALMLQVLAGLEAVHRRGIVHRDLKPENLMLVQDDGEVVVKILDFGISKMISAEAGVNLTSPGLVVGTPQYMSPEQARNAAEIDHRTDVYSAGAILYRMLTGALPHDEESLSALIAAKLSAPVAPPSSRRPDLSRGLDSVVLRALEREPGRRFADARAFREALAPFAAERAEDRAAAAAPMAIPQDLDPSQLVLLDEVSGPGARPEEPATPSPHEPPGQTEFEAPQDEQRDLEIEGTGGTRRPAVPAAPPPPSDPEQVAKLRATGPYGQARRTHARTGLWIALGVAVVAGGLGYVLVVSSGAEHVNPAAVESQARVQVRIDVYPKWAEVTVDGVALTSQPLVLQRSSREHLVTVRAKGYWSQTVAFQPLEDRSILVELKPRER